MYPLFGFELFEITPIGLLALIGWAIAGFYIGKQLLKDDRELRAIQREADDLSDELSKIGFTLLPPILRDLAFMDLIQLKADVKHAIAVLKDPAKRRLDFANVLEGLLKEAAKDVDTRQGFLNGVVAMFKSQGVVPTGDPATDAVGNKIDPVKLVQDTSFFQPSPVTVHFHNNGGGSQDVAADATAAPAKA